MTSVKKELQDSGIGSSGGSNKKVAACSSKTNNNNKGVEVVSIPSDDWFTQMYGPMGENSEEKILNAKKGEGTKRKKILKNTKIKAKKRKRISSTTTNSTSSDLIEIDVSDGEDLNQVFPPLLSPQTSKNKEENKVEKTEKDEIRIEKNLVKNDKNKEEASFSDDDLDFVVLFESITEKNLKRENAQDNDDSDDSFIFSKNTLKRPPRIIKNAQDQVRNDIEENFGITLYPNKILFEKISNYMNKYKNEFDNFNRNIWTHFTENLQNDHTYTWKMRVKCMLEDIVKQIFPNESISLVAVGSTVNGCGAFNSDMDLCLCMPCRMDGYETQRNYAINRLKKVMRKLLTKRTLIHDILFVPAKVPILKIKFKHPYQKLEVDMNINNVPGIYNSYLIHYYSRIDDRFPALCLIVKHWAKKKGILDACSGYFNSYSLILMVLHFLQCGINIPILPNLQHLFPDYFHFFRALDEMQLFVDLPKPLPEIPKNTLSIGELLIAFFNYYNNFNFDEYAISVYRGCIYPRSELARNTRRFKIFIEEPFDFKNTARCVTSEDNFLTILDTFREAVEICCSLPPNLKRLIAS